MQGLILRWVINAAALFFIGSIIQGIHVQSFWAGLMAAAALGIINAVIRPIVTFFTWPLNFLTLGLFPLVINAVFLLMVSGLVKGFTVEGFLPAFFGSIVLSFISGFLNFFVR